MAWNKIGNGFMNENPKSTPQNKLPEFSGDLKLEQDLKRGDKINIALWRNVREGKEYFNMAASTHEKSTVS